MYFLNFCHLELEDPDSGAGNDSNWLCLWTRHPLLASVLSLKITVLSSQEYCKNERHLACESTSPMENHNAVIGTGTDDKKNYNC